jgi:hypothetical protein
MTLQLENHEVASKTQLVARMFALANHVLSHLDRYAVTEAERQQIKAGWDELRDLILKCKERMAG